MDVRILGTLEAREGGRTIDLGLRQARVAFAVLALHAGSPVRSARLADLLWPEGPPRSWEGTVQSHVSRLRKALEPKRRPREPSVRLVTQGDAYVLELADDELDARRFEGLASAGRGAMARGEPLRAAELFQEALAEWRGSVLADLRDPSALGPEVVRLEELRDLTMEERCEALVASGDHRRAIADLEVMVEASPLRERCWELLLLALYRSGRQSEAVRRYQEVRALLVGELGIEPGPALRALEVDILRHAPGLGGHANGPSATPGAEAIDIPLPSWLQPPEDAFVGRRSELYAVVDAFERSVRGERLLTVVAGEPGIGKSRVIREAARELVRRGAVVLGGRCVEEPLHVLEPFAEAVGRLASEHGERLEREAPGDVTVLAGLVPGLSKRAVPFASLDADAHRYLLFRAVSGLLDSRGLSRPVVLVLDDLHWAAPAALQLLIHVLHDDERGPLLVLATARDTETSEALAAMLTDLRRERRLDLIPVGGLDAEETAALASARSGHRGVSDLFEMTEGNPFYIEELVRHFAESGDEASEEGLPDSVRDTIARRLLRLPEPSRRVLGVAAVAGRAFRLDVVARSAGIDVDAADDALDVASRAGIVSDHSQPTGSYAFTHALIPAALRQGLGAARQARVHRRYGEALAALDGDAGEVARHLLAAAEDGSDVVPGVEAALVAARRAVGQYTYHDAIALLEPAWAAIADRPAADVGLVCRLAIALARTLRRAGAYDERTALLEQAWARASAIGSEELRADVILEGCAATVDPGEPWVLRAEEVHARLEEDSDRRVMLTAILCYVRAREPGERAKELAEWAMARVSRLEPADRRAVTEYCISVIAASSPAERVVDLARGVVVEARESGNEFEVIEALSVLRRVQLAAADIVACEETAREYEELVSSVRVPRFMAGVEQRRAMMALLQGRFAEAEAHATETVALQPLPEFLEGFAVQLFGLRFEQGRLEEVREAVEGWAARDTRVAWTLGLSVLQAELGELDAAERTLSPVVASEFDAVPRDELFFLSLAVAAWTVVLLEDRRSAVELYELLLPHASRVVVAAEGAVCWGSVHRFLGPLSVLAGSSDRAAMHFEAAISIHERLGALPFLARDRIAYARLLRQRGGDVVRIDELHRTGLALARRLGMAAVVARGSTESLEAPDTPNGV
jgi:DNA-binding SARP family transcriptional activator